MTGKKTPQPMRQSCPNVIDPQSTPSNEDVFFCAGSGMTWVVAPDSAIMRQASRRSSSRRRDSEAIWDCVNAPSPSSGDSLFSSAAMDARCSRRGLST